MSELKPCELCSGDYHTFYDGVGFKVNCQNKHCKLYLVAMTKEQWQTRTQSQCEPLIEFAKYIIQCSFDGFNVDSGSAQDKAAELGLINLERYSIDAHGYNDVGAENGDDWFVFSDLLLPPKAGE